MYCKSLQVGQRRDVRDRVVGQVERLEIDQVLDRLQVDDLVLGELEQRQVLALLKTGQVLDAFLGSLQDVHVLELLVGQLDVGLVLQDAPDGGFQVLVGKG